MSMRRPLSPHAASACRALPPDDEPSRSQLRLDAVLFDLDGVLVDSRGPIARCLNHALSREGLEPEPEQALHRWIGPPLHDAFAALLSARGAPRSRIPACIAHYRELYAEISAHETPAFDGIPHCLEELGARLELAVATSKPEAFARPILESLGLADHFRLIAAPPLEATHREDKTRVVGRALEALGLVAGAGRVAMVGDRDLDVRAGRSHGLCAVGACWGIGGEAELREAGADHLVALPKGLAPLLLDRGIWQRKARPRLGRGV